MQPYPNINYFTQYPQFQQPQMAQPMVAQPQVIQPQLAKMVNDFNEITIGDIPTNGTAAFFIKADMSEIQSRRWSEDGRVLSNTYAIQTEVNEPKTDPFEEIIKRLDAIDEKIVVKPTRRKEPENE